MNIAHAVQFQESRNPA